IGLAPIAQPPGSETLACPKRATRGPSTSTLARICLTSSYGASGRTLEPAATSTSGAATFTSRPRKRSNAAVVSMSRRAGTLRRRLAPSERRVAQRMGRAAFLAPLIRTAPRSGPPPRIRIASMLRLLPEFSAPAKEPAPGGDAAPPTGGGKAASDLPRRLIFGQGGEANPAHHPVARGEHSRMGLGRDDPDGGARPFDLGAERLEPRGRDHRFDAREDLGLFGLHVVDRKSVV